MSKKQSVWDSASASRFRPYEEAELEVNQDGPTQEWIIPVDVRSTEEIQAQRLAYVERRLEENRQKLLRVFAERERVAAAANRQGNLHPFQQARILQRFEGLNYLEISDDESSTITTVDSLVDTMEGEEVNQ